MARDLNAHDVRAQLGFDDSATDWLEELAALVLRPDSVRLPESHEARSLLARLNVPITQIDEVVGTMPSVERDPALCWLIERCASLLNAQLGNGDQLRAWPSLPSGLGAIARYGYVWAFLAALPSVRRFHAEHGIPDDISWSTLADLGGHMAIYERAHGVGGLSSQNWLTLHFRGAIYQLGRLQFNFGRFRYEPSVIAGMGAPFRQGDPALGVHIPEAGPLSPAACTDSFAQARAFFPRHFPDTPYPVATCGSWLLDEQLAEYLPADSNIVRFQRRFQLAPGGRVCDGEIIWFVFRQRTDALEELPQRTTLERAIVAHLRAGRHWLARSGWLEL